MASQLHMLLYMFLIIACNAVRHTGADVVKVNPVLKKAVEAHTKTKAAAMHCAACGMFLAKKWSRQIHNTKISSSFRNECKSCLSRSDVNSTLKNVVAHRTAEYYLATRQINSQEAAYDWEKEKDDNVNIICEDCLNHDWFILGITHDEETDMLHSCGKCLRSPYVKYTSKHRVSWHLAETFLTSFFETPNWDHTSGFVPPSPTSDCPNCGSGNNTFDKLWNRFDPATAAVGRTVKMPAWYIAKSNRQISAHVDIEVAEPDIAAMVVAITASAVIVVAFFTGVSKLIKAYRAKHSRPKSKKAAGKKQAPRDPVITISECVFHGAWYVVKLLWHGMTGQIARTVYLVSLLEVAAYYCTEGDFPWSQDEYVPYVQTNLYRYFQALHPAWQPLVLITQFVLSWFWAKAPLAPFKLTFSILRSCVLSCYSYVSDSLVPSACTRMARIWQCDSVQYAIFSIQLSLYMIYSEAFCRQAGAEAAADEMAGPMIQHTTAASSKHSKKTNSRQQRSGKQQNSTPHSSTATISNSKNSSCRSTTPSDDEHCRPLNKSSDANDSDVDAAVSVANDCGTQPGSGSGSLPNIGTSSGGADGAASTPANNCTDADITVPVAIRQRTASEATESVCSMAKPQHDSSRGTAGAAASRPTLIGVAAAAPAVASSASSATCSAATAATSAHGAATATKTAAMAEAQTTCIQSAATAPKSISDRLHGAAVGSATAVKTGTPAKAAVASPRRAVAVAAAPAVTSSTATRSSGASKTAATAAKGASKASTAGKAAGCATSNHVPTGKPAAATATAAAASSNADVHQRKPANATASASLSNQPPVASSKVAAASKTVTAAAAAKASSLSDHTRHRDAAAAAAAAAPVVTTAATAVQQHSHQKKTKVQLAPLKVDSAAVDAAAAGAAVVPTSAKARGGNASSTEGKADTSKAAAAAAESRKGVQLHSNALHKNSKSKAVVAAGTTAAVTAAAAAAPSVVHVPAAAPGSARRKAVAKAASPTAAAAAGNTPPACMGQKLMHANDAGAAVGIPSAMAAAIAAAQTSPAAAASGSSSSSSTYGTASQPCSLATSSSSGGSSPTLPYNPLLAAPYNPLAVQRTVSSGAAAEMQAATAATVPSLTQHSGSSEIPAVQLQWQEQQLPQYGRCSSQPVSPVSLCSEPAMRALSGDATFNASPTAAADRSAAVQAAGQTSLLSCAPRKVTPVASSSSSAADAAAQMAAVAAMVVVDDDDGADDDDMLCVVCWEQQRSVGLLHGDLMHLCLCASCAHAFGRGSACPMCRQQVEDRIEVA